MTYGKYNLLAAMSAIALVAAGPALARDMKLFPAGPTPPSSNMNINVANAASDTGAYMQAPSEIRAESLVGKKLINAQGDSIGDTESVIIDHDGRVAALVVGVGGYLGIGEHRVAIAWKDIQVLDGGKTIKTGLTKTKLKALPEYHYRQSANGDTSSMSLKYPKGGDDKDLRMVGGAKY